MEVHVRQKGIEKDRKREWEREREEGRGWLNDHVVVFSVAVAAAR